MFSNQFCLQMFYRSVSQISTSLSRAHQCGMHYFVQNYYPYPKISASALKLISLQLPCFILECLIYTSENIWEPFVLAHIIFCSAQKNGGLFHCRHNNGHCACETHGSSSLHYSQPPCAPLLLRLGRLAFPLGLVCSECFGLYSRRSEADQTHRILLLNRRRAMKSQSPWNHSSVMIWVGKRLQVLSLQL